MATKTAPKKKAEKPEPKNDGDAVIASAANKSESRVGVTHVLATAELDGVSVSTLEGARAEVEVKKQVLDQAGLLTLGKVIAQAAQETY